MEGDKAYPIGEVESRLGNWRAKDYCYYYCYYPSFLLEKILPK